MHHDGVISMHERKLPWTFEYSEGELKLFVPFAFAVLQVAIDAVGVERVPLETQLRLTNEPDGECPMLLTGKQPLRIRTVVGEAWSPENVPRNMYTSSPTN